MQVYPYAITTGMWQAINKLVDDSPIKRFDKVGVKLADPTTLLVAGTDDYKVQDAQHSNISRTIQISFLVTDSSDISYRYLDLTMYVAHNGLVVSGSLHDWLEVNKLYSDEELIKKCVKILKQTKLRTFF